MKNIFSKAFLKRFFVGSREPEHLFRQHHDWRINIVIFLVLCVAVIIASLYMYYRINQGNLFIVPKTEENATKTFNREKLSETADALQKRANIHYQLINGGSPLVDPVTGSF